MEPQTNIKVNNRTEVEQLIRSNAEAIRGFGAEQLYLFGSFERDYDIIEESDVDLVVQFFNDQTTLNSLVYLGDFLENLFGRKVDLITLESLRSGSGLHIKKNSALIDF